MDKQLRRSAAEGSNTGERCVRRTWRGTRRFGGDADVHAGYDGGDASRCAVSDTGTSSGDRITSSGVLSLTGIESGATVRVLDRWRDDVDKAASEVRPKGQAGEDCVRPDVARTRVRWGR